MKYWIWAGIGVAIVIIVLLVCCLCNLSGDQTDENSSMANEKINGDFDSPNKDRSSELYAHNISNDEAYHS